MELVLGPLTEGQTIQMSDIKLTDILARFDTVELTSPVHPPLPDGNSELIELARKELQVGEVSEYRSDPLPQLPRLMQEIIRDGLKRYVEPKNSSSDRLYALEFQGSRQYVMFGHTKNLIGRVTEHQRAATPHGYAMLNGWASPWVDDARALEQVALFVGGLIHHQHYRERFYDMSFEIGLKIVRLVFELNSDWSSRPRINNTSEMTR